MLTLVKDPKDINDTELKYLLNERLHQIDLNIEKYQSICMDLIKIIETQTVEITELKNEITNNMVKSNEVTKLSELLASYITIAKPAQPTAKEYPNTGKGILNAVVDNHAPGTKEYKGNEIRQIHAILPDGSCICWNKGVTVYDYTTTTDKVSRWQHFTLLVKP